MLLKTAQPPHSQLPGVKILQIDFFVVGGVGVGGWGMGLELSFDKGSIHYEHRRTLIHFFSIPENCRELKESSLRNGESPRP